MSNICDLENLHPQYIHPRENQLLAALPEPELQRWLPDLEYVELPLAEVLYEAGSTLSHVYFPTKAIGS